MSTRVCTAPLTYAVDGISANIVVGKNKHKNKIIPRIKAPIFVKQKTTEKNSSGWRLETIKRYSAVYSIYSTALQPYVGVFFLFKYFEHRFQGFPHPIIRIPDDDLRIANIVRSCNKKNTAVAGGISECPERKERRKRNWTL